MPKTYKVKEGETLWGIAQRELGAGSRWEDIKGAPDDPTKLQIGQKLTLPTQEDLGQLDAQKAADNALDKSTATVGGGTMQQLGEEGDKTEKTEGYWQKEVKRSEEEAERLRKELKEKEEEEKGIIDKTRGMIQSGIERMRGVRAEGMEDWQVEETREEMMKSTEAAGNLREQLVGLKAQEKAEIDKLREPGRFMTTGAQQARIAETKRDFKRRQANVATQLSAVTANVEMMRGNLATARSFINDAVQAATYEEELKFKELDLTLQMNQEEIADLEEEYKTAMVNARDDAEKAYVEKKEEQDQVGKLQESLATQYGINKPLVGMSLEEARKEYNRLVAPKVAEQREAELTAQQALTQQRLGAGGGAGIRLTVAQQRTQLNSLVDNSTMRLNALKGQLESGISGKIPPKERISKEQAEKYGFTHQNISKAELEAYKSLPDKIKDKVSKDVVYNQAGIRRYEWTGLDFTYSEAQSLYESGGLTDQPTTADYSDTELQASWKEYKQDNPSGTKQDWITVMNDTYDISTDRLSKIGDEQETTEAPSVATPEEIEDEEGILSKVWGGVKSFLNPFD